MTYVYAIGGYQMVGNGKYAVASNGSHVLRKQDYISNFNKDKVKGIRFFNGYGNTEDFRLDRDQVELR